MNYRAIPSLVVSLALLSSASALSTSQSGRWVARAWMPTVRAALAVGVVQGKLYAVGGVDSNNVTLPTVEAYDPSTNSWTTCANMPTPRRAYDPATNRWTVKAPLPEAEAGLAVAVLNGRLYAMGGKDSFFMAKTTLMYDPATDRWTPKAELSVGRHGLAAGVAGGKIYTLGGFDHTFHFVPAVETLAYTP